ncbi:ABC transporter substrate-binding protein [Paenibacillaceae bacterium WGS1546]|uniref:ABC transporter substrate-binding protein n=1 Tax=Cohnella sp. WGS1546 TaxID=3366810 RepID=UPI00372D7FDF
MNNKMGFRLIVMLVSLLLVLSGCGSSNGNAGQNPESAQPEASGNNGGKENVELTLVYPSDPGAEKKLNALIDEYRKTNPHVTVKFVFIPFSGWPDYITKVKTMIAGGNSPDLLRLAVEGIEQLVNDDLAMPFDDFLAANPDFVQSVNIGDIHPNINAPFKINGKTYGLAWDWNNVVMHINTELLREAGLEMPNGTWTKDEFLQYAQALTKEKNGQKQYGFMIPSDYFLTTGFLYNNNASILNEDMTKSTLDDPKAIEVIQFMHDLVYKYKVSPVPGPNVDASRLFMTGQLAMYPAGRWPILGYQDNQFTDFDVQYLPEFQTQKVAFGTGAFPVLKTSKHTEEAMRLAAWLSGSEYSQKNFLATDSIPSRVSVMKELLPNEKPDNGVIFGDSADIAVPIQAPVQYTDVANAFTKYLSMVYSNQMTVEDAMKAAAKEIDGIVGK